MTAPSGDNVNLRIPAIDPETGAAERRRGQIRPALQAAIEAIVECGLTQREAADLVGMQAVSLNMALQKPHVKAFMADVKRAWMESATSQAWQTVSHLMRNGKSEDVKLKAARTVLEAAGELGGDRDGGSDKAKTLINIVLNAPGQVAPTPSSGVIEAPFRDITPRQNRAQDVSINDE